MALDDLPDPVFITNDPNEIVSESIIFYETQANKTLQPADTERLQINGASYRESLLRSQMNEAAKQNLVRFAKAPILDYIGERVGVKRLAARPADCNIEFSLVPGHGNVVIPLRTRVQTVDGQTAFYTTKATPVSIGIDSVVIVCKAVDDGVIGNGYIAGNVTTILDPQAFLASAANTNTTGNGIDDETDESLRGRIILAPEAFSTAGSLGAYIFWAKTANQLIIDVSAFSPSPLVMNIYPLVAAAGGTPPQIIADVYAATSGEKVRPLNDIVNVYSPTEVPYDIEVELTLYDNADQVTTEALVNAALQSYADDHRKALGLDVVVKQIEALCMVKGATYNAVVISPSADVVLDKTEYSQVGTITVTTVGLNNG